MFYFLDLCDKSGNMEICHDSMNNFMRAESDLLLVKGIQLVVDQPQLLRMRHLMLLLGVRLTRLLHTLAARHCDSFQRFSGDVQVRYRSPLGRRTEFLDSRQERARRYRTATVHARLYLPIRYIDRHPRRTARKPRPQVFGIFYRISNPRLLL